MTAVLFDALPRVLDDFVPTRGVIKGDYEDFVVEEKPLYPADGRGTHTYFLLEKAGLTTQQAVHDLARALNVRRQEIGFAGLKDARAVTRQWMSVEHVDPDAVRKIDLPRLRILEVTQHGNKLRLGHLKANHFQIRVREAETERLGELQQAVQRLQQVGVPNYFGPQRFGYRGDTGEVGKAVLHGRSEDALDLILGRPTELDDGAVRAARMAYEEGEYEKAIDLWPRMFHTERRALKALLRAKGKKKRALAAIDRSTRTFFVSAYQSQLFNEVVAQRVRDRTLGTLSEGDLAWLHVSGAVFRVEDVAKEQPRATALEISPTGPLFGYRMTAPTGAPGALEEALREREALTDNVFREGKVRVKGSRRPVRFPLEDARVSLGADDRGAYLEFEFALPRGCYATVVLRELFHLEGDAARTGDAAEAEGTA
jgi:tRNA pseudouridine13 synthase